MTDKPYTLLDALREEIDTLTELESIYRKDKNLLTGAISAQRRSLQRIVNRYEKGHEYFWGVTKEGDPQLQYRQGTRHLEREYPAVANAKRNLNTLVSITKGD
jgi:hypothetical protein